MQKTAFKFKQDILLPGEKAFYYDGCKLMKTVEVMYCFIQNECICMYMYMYIFIQLLPDRWREEKNFASDTLTKISNQLRGPIGPSLKMK